MSEHIPLRPAFPSTSPTVASPLPLENTSVGMSNNDTLRREADQMARQLEGISKRLKRFRDALKD